MIFFLNFFQDEITKIIWQANRSCPASAPPCLYLGSPLSQIAMALSMAPSMLAFAPVMPAVRAPTQAVNVRMETQTDLETLANKLNPAVGA
jgi:hypothetical protein